MLEEVFASIGPKDATPRASIFLLLSHKDILPKVIELSTVGNSIRSMIFSGESTAIAATHVVPPPSTAPSLTITGNIYLCLEGVFVLEVARGMCSNRATGIRFSRVLQKFALDLTNIEVCPLFMPFPLNLRSKVAGMSSVDVMSLPPVMTNDIGLRR